MNYYIKPLKPFSDVKFVDDITIVDQNNKDIEFKIFEYSDDRITVLINNNTQMVRDYAINNAYETNQLICFRSNGTKTKVVPQIEVFKQNSTRVQKNEEVLDIEDLNIETTKLRDLEFPDELFIPMKTNTGLDQFFSLEGGIMPATNILVTGDPGVGKSSNLMDILCNLKKNKDSIRGLYISAEMNQREVKNFEKWYPGLKDIDFLYLADYVIEDKGIPAYQALQAVLNQGWDIVIMDSLVEVMSMVGEDLQMTTPKVERWLLNLLNQHNKGSNKLGLYTSFLCIQQKNKSGQYVGSKRLEHMTSAFLQLKWDEKERGKRYMMFSKNRNGKENIKLYYNFNNGIQYDVKKYQNELEIIEKSMNFKDEDLPEMDMDSFFNELKNKVGLTVDNLQ